ncbi:MAG: hypothetical protein LUD84_04710 [Clostridiales bacterium]|nr:hypothetical protein [Clostridiales bacterium]
MTMDSLLGLFLLLGLVTLLLGVVRKALKIVMFAIVLLLLWGGMSGALTTLFAAL